LKVSRGVKKHGPVGKKVGPRWVAGKEAACRKERDPVKSQETRGLVTV
jgi:hypothetical protein